ncbi:MAG: ammonia channel protein, partial [Steroidobacterales bacterium]
TGSVLLQLKGVTATLVWSFVMSLIILKVIDLVIGLRVTADEEREGLDLTQHGERIE